MDLPSGKEIAAKLRSRTSLSEDTALLVDLTRTFAEREVAPLLEALECSGGKPTSTLVEGLRSSGLLALTLPEEKEGAGLDTRDAARCVEALSRVSAGIGTLLAAHLAAIGAGANSDFGTGVLWSLGAEEPSAVSQAKKGKKGREVKVTGTWSSVPGAAVAAVMVVPSPGGGWLAVKLEADEADVAPWQGALGLNGAGLAKVSLRDAPAVRLEDTQTDPVAVLQIMLAAVSVGLASDATERALSYANERYQGGKIIIGHSVIQDMIAEPAASTLAARSILYDGSVEEHASPKVVAALAVRAAVHAADGAVQVHGGYGYMADYRVEALLRDARTLETALIAPEKAVRDWLVNAIEGCQ